MIKSLYDSLFSSCKDLIAEPKVIEFREMQKVMPGEANKLGNSVLQSQYKNLLRSLSNKFQELEFITYVYQQIKVIAH